MMAYRCALTLVMLFVEVAVFKFVMNAIGYSMGWGKAILVLYFIEVFIFFIIQNIKMLHLKLKNRKKNKSSKS